MASLNSWLSPGVMRALAWALIHSLWQCLAVAALAAVLMAFSRRPPLRYLIAIGALALMLAAPAATFFVLTKPAAIAASASISADPQIVAPVAPVAVPSKTMIERVPLADLPRPSPNILAWLVAAWLCGVVCFSLRFAGGFLLLEHKRRSRSTAPSPRILAICRELQDRLGLTRAIRYLECSWLQAPAVIGWLRPIVLLPVCALTGLSEAQLRAVIAHELAHIRRLDAFVNLFQILVETLLFYHPAVWWLNKRIRAERELCCDEIALSLSGDRLEYAQALTLMAQWESAPALAMAANSGPLTERVFHVLGHQSSGAGQRMIGLTGSILFLAAALAAANALFGAGSALPMARARESVKIGLETALSSVSDHARQIFPASEPAEKGTHAKSAATAMVQPANPAKNPETLMPPPSADLSQLLPRENLSTPAIVASLDARTATANGQPATSAPATQGTGASLQRCSNRNVYGVAISPTVIKMPGFSCFLGVGEGTPESLRFNFGSCPLASTYLSRPNYRPSCKWDTAMNVRLADPADAAKMVPGKLVRLAGNFRVTMANHIAYLAATDAKVIWSDPFSRLAKVAPRESSATPAVVAPPDAPAASALPATVQASLNIPPAEQATIHSCRNTSVFGRVVSPKAIEMQGFTCFVDGAPGDTPATGVHDMPFGSCPLASSTTAHKYKCEFDVAMNVRLANPADTAKMVPGKLVRLGGDFRVWKENKADYLTVTNARVLFTDYFWNGSSKIPLPEGMPGLPDMSQQAAHPIPPASQPNVIGGGPRN